MSFALDLSRLVEKAKGQTEVVVKRVMLETFSKVVMKSPVLSGRFRNNWVIGNASANLATTTEVDKAGAGTIGRIAKDISAVDLTGQSIWLTNSLPYSLKLERGHSKQSPQGMVRLSLIEITSKYGG